HTVSSGSGPLTAAPPHSFLSASLGGTTVPVTETIFAGWNLLAILGVIVVCGLLFLLMAPNPGALVYELPASVTSDKQVQIDEEVVTPADRIDASRILTLIVGLALVVYLIIHF